MQVTLLIELCMLVVCFLFNMAVVEGQSNSDNQLVPPDPAQPLPPSASLLGVYKEAAVATNAVPCADIGRDVLTKGGNAVDAAIAALFCEGVAGLKSMGLGGGFLMTIYIKESNTSITLNAREVAPLAATEDMFGGNSTLAQFGGLSVAVPGELKGYYEAYERHGSGNVSWADLVQHCIHGNHGNIVSVSMATLSAAGPTSCNIDLCIHGKLVCRGVSVAVPGELKGYYEAYERHGSGNVSWADLVQPTIDLCIHGNLVTSYLSRVLQDAEKNILASPSMKEFLIDPATGRVWKEGDRIKRLKLADTLKVIQVEGSDALYTANGSLMADFVADVKELGGIITEQDMVNYTVRWEEPITASLNDGMSMYTAPPPGSGVLVAFIFNILDGFLPELSEVTKHHRIVEAIKHGFGRRTGLGDPHFVDMVELIANLTSPAYAAEIRREIRDDRTWQDPTHYGAVWTQPDDRGTAHISVLAPNGDAVSVTSTLNRSAMIASNKTGIILNDEMDDFAAPNITNGFGVPPSPANMIRPGKRPLSSMCPTIFVDKHGDVQLVVGAAGGTKITTATLLVALETLWYNKTIKEAVDASRFHHQLFPMHFQYEFGMPHALVQGLARIGHNMTRYNTSEGSSVTAIARRGDSVHANADYRRGGITAGF